MLLLLLAAAAPQSPAAAPRTAIEAERGFAADAQALGQWTAFRKWAAPDATIFLPAPANAQVALREWRNPPRSIAWSPTASFVSCDGRVAVNTGEWRGAENSAGFFSTVWERQPGGAWRWHVDGGDVLGTPRARVATPTVRRAACGGAERAGRVAPPDGPGATVFGHSGDNTVHWAYRVDPRGGRVFRAALWTGQRMEIVVDDHIAAPPSASPPPRRP